LLAVAVLVATACIPETFTVNGCVFDRVTGPPFPEDSRVYTADCPGADLRWASLSGIDLYLAEFPDANLRSANLRGSGLIGVGLWGADLKSARMQDAYALGGVWTETRLANAQLQGAAFVEVVGDRVDLTGADLTGARFDEVWWNDSDFTGTLVVPASVSVVASGPTGAVVTWPEPATIPEHEDGTGVGAAPGPCDHPSGSTFPVGVTLVTCDVLLPGGTGNFGTFTVTVTPAA
jgi:hypothetical protein